MLHELCHQAKHCSIQSKLGNYVPIDKEEFQTVLREMNASPTNITRLLNYVKENNGALPGIPCSFFHPKSENCTQHCAYLWLKVFYDMVPVYGALTVIPLIFFKFKNFISQ